MFLLLAMGCALCAYAGQPDFSGDWRLGEETLKIQQKDSAVTINSAKFTLGDDAHMVGSALVLKTGERYEFTDTPGQLKQTREGKTWMFHAIGTGKHAESNFQEDKVGWYTLPEPLKLANGERVTSKEMWVKQRRPELVRLFEENMYGRVPEAPRDMKFAVKAAPALDGKAIRKEVTITFAGHEDGAALHVLVYLPAKAGRAGSAVPGSEFFGQCGGGRSGERWRALAIRQAGGAWLRAGHHVDRRHGS